MVAEHSERNFDVIFNFKAAQNVVAFHYERDFDMIFHFKAAQNLVVEHYEFMKEILTCFFTLSSSTLGCLVL